MKEQGKTHRCCECRRWFEKSKFESDHGHLNRFICNECDEFKMLRKCFLCGMEKPKSEFSATRWNQILQRRICLECSGDKCCSICRLRDGPQKFTPDEWAKPDGKRRCKNCLPRQCLKCRKTKAMHQFSKSEQLKEISQAVCIDCDRRRCGRCNKEKTYKDFEPSIWELADGSPQYCCRECTQGRRVPGMWTCANNRCRMQKPLSDFDKIIKQL